MKILLVDDEPFALKVLSRQLANLGFADIDCHERAHDAIATIEEAAGLQDLIFCDLQMPEMDGVEFVRHLARVEYRGGLVLVSGEDERILKTVNELAKAHQLNVLGALHKPVAVDALRKVLGKQLARAGITRQAARKVYTSEELARAMDAGDLINYYQPKVNLNSGAVFGVETLVRWNHPQDGLVFPDQFVGIAEEHGLVDRLTQSVLVGALEQMKSWKCMGLDLHVAVNVCMDNLVSLQFPDWVEQTAADAGVPTRQLLLEITESRLMKNPLAVLDILTRLRLKHIGLSIDDFGTGYSSLAQLRDIPFVELKIDQGFVHGACRDASLQTIFEASCGIGRKLGMNFVAEGVEDRADWNFLRNADCDLAQGYFIAKPMPADDLADWISDWEERYEEIQDSAP